MKENNLIQECLECLVHGRYSEFHQKLPELRTTGLEEALLENLGLIAVQAEAREMRLEEIIRELRTAKARLARENRQLKSVLEQREVFPMGQSRAMADVMRMAERVAPSEASVLILGESGSGKEVLARWIHEASPRKSAPFVALNCAALPESLLEAELFGIEKGTATGVDARLGKFEAAQGGTLFLDEIGDMALGTQARILRVLQEREVTRLGSHAPRRIDIRVLAATHRNLKALVDKGDFRQDLYYRLAIVVLELPALRHRREDILPLARFLARNLAARAGQTGIHFSRDAEEALLIHAWPGNIRELRNAVERGLLMAEDGIIRASDLGLAPDLTIPAESKMDASPGGLRLKPSEEEERRIILEALSCCRGRISEAARQLGVSRETIRLKMKNWPKEWQLKAMETRLKS